MSTEATLHSHTPNSAMSPQAIEDQLQRLLASPLFSHSRRYPGFLRHVVDEALKGHQDHLKERSIGIDVFHRVPDYDLNVDPVVRVTAGEVRKRLAQYYYEPEHQDELRIELKPGSYVPEFKLALERVRSVSELHVETTGSKEHEVAPPATSFSSMSEASTEASPSPAEPTVRAASRHRRRFSAAILLGSLAVLLAAGIALYVAHSHSALETFWQPVWKSSAPVLISVGSWETASPGAGDVSIGTHAKSSDPIALSDTVTIASMQQLLSQHARPSQIQSSAQTTFSDLQRGTTILISGFDNPWTMRLTDPLRFHFVAQTADILTIQDRNNPGQNGWEIDTRSPYSKLTRDFAIVARFHDPTTEQNIVVAAGIGENGTIAAGQMLTNEQLLQAGEKAAGTAKNYSNIEFVIETLVIDGKSGPPRVVAVTTW